MLKLGDVEAMKQDYRAEATACPWIENLLQDVRYAIRSQRPNSPCS
jgi:hypothetical protein